MRYLLPFLLSRVRPAGVHRLLSVFLVLCFVFLTSTGSVADTSRDLGPKPRWNFVRMEDWILFYSNLERTDRDLPPLLHEESLSLAARWQARYCSEKRQLSHTAADPSMRTVGRRISRFQEGRTPSRWGENVIVIFQTNTSGKQYMIKRDAGGVYRDYGKHEVRWYSEREAARTMVLDWMKSPGHRANLLRKEFRRMGPGVVPGIYRKEPAFYGVQVFSGDRGIEIGDFVYDVVPLPDGKTQLYLRLLRSRGLEPVVFGYGNGTLRKLEGTPRGEGVVFEVPPDDENDMIYRMGAKERSRDLYYPVRRVQWLKRAASPESPRKSLFSGEPESG